MTTPSDVLDGRLDTYAQIARRRARESTTIGLDGPSNWKRFAAATGATLAGVATADGAVVHFMPQTPIRVEMQLAYPYVDFQNIDIDDNGVDDMFIGAVSSFYSFLNGYRYNGSAQGLDGQMVFLGAEGLIRKLANDTVIPAVAPTSTGAIIRTSATSSYSYGIARELGEWGRDDTGLAGFVLGTGGSRRAGWIQFRTESFENLRGINRMGTLDVLQWAYESVPGVSIKAGQTTGVAVPGDYDGNGTVGPEDYTLWKTTFGNTVASGAGADGNKNTKIDAADYTVWRNNFDSGSGSLLAETAVPEPSTVTLGVLALGAAGVAALRRRAK
jgi:hypothetical protein